MRFFLATLFLIGCAEKETEFVVKVGDRFLTKSALDSAMVGVGRSDEAVRQAYIREWVNSEVLYQEAIKAGLEKNPLVVSQLQNIRREILIQFLLDIEIEKSMNITAQDIEKYYEANKDQYIYPEDHVKTEYFLTKDMAKAKFLTREFYRMSRLRKKDFLEFVTPYAEEKDVIGVTEFAPRSHFEDRVARQIFLRNTTDDIVGPLPLTDGYQSFWHVVEIRPKGKAIPVQEVSHEIEMRVKAAKRRTIKEDLVRKLREQISIEYAMEDSL